MLIISKSQLGYNYNSLSLIQILTKFNFNIEYLSYFEYRDPCNCDNKLKVIEVYQKSSKFISNIRLFLTIFKNIKRHQIIYIYYFYGCSIFPIIFRKKKFFLDIRTGSILTNRFLNKTANTLLRIEASFFQQVFVISESLRDKLKLHSDRVGIVPIIPHKIKFREKKFNELVFLYIGTLKNRRIEDTIIGLKNLYDMSDYYKEIVRKYIIVGDKIAEYYKIKNLIEEYGLGDRIILNEWVTPDKLDYFFEQSNVGISYIPINDIYNVQPPTKTIEYMLAGIPVIGTGTLENKKLINDNCGVICDDNPESFTNAVIDFIEKRNVFDSNTIYDIIQKNTSLIMNNIEELYATKLLYEE